MAAGDQQTVLGVFYEDNKAVKAAAEKAAQKEDEMTERLKAVSQELRTVE